MKLFISQPMKGKTDEEILTERKRAIEKAEEQLGEKLELIDSFFQEAPEVKTKGLYYLGKSLELLATADVVFFCKGWENYRGCRVEYTCAIEYGVETVIDDYDEEKQRGNKEQAYGKKS